MRNWIKDKHARIGIKVGLFIIVVGLLLLLAVGLLQDSWLAEILGFLLTAFCFPFIFFDLFFLSSILVWVCAIVGNGILWGLLVSGYLRLEEWWGQRAHRKHTQPQGTPADGNGDAARKVFRRMLVSLIAVAFFGFYAMPHAIPTHGEYFMGLTAIELDLLLLPPIIALCFSNSRSPSRWWLYYGLLCCCIIIPALQSYIFYCDSGRRPWAGLDHDWKMKLRILIEWIVLAPFLIAWTKSVLIKAWGHFFRKKLPAQVDPASSAANSDPK
ncbi:MAG: hypothetical protein NTY53_18945 [Kiritimatiellaeota bacterium]|nr:hypothetical protein [Kiritimatiellota bacterium]